MTPTPTDHARQQWVRRAAQHQLIDAVTDRGEYPAFIDAQITDAWTEGVVLPDDVDLRGDEFRYHEPTDTVLVRTQDVIRTIVHAPTCTAATRAIIERVCGGDVSE